MSSNPTIAALEQKYIELLEKKIARLESSDGNEQSKKASLVEDSPDTTNSIILLTSDRKRKDQLPP